MLDVLRLAAVFGLILALVRFKWNIGYILLLASGLLALLYLMPVPAIGQTVVAALTDAVTWQFLLALTLIRMVEMVLREQQVLARMMEAARMYLKNKKAVIISMPLLIGMLPSLGGAYFSAPMVEEATRGLKVCPEEKSFINYWFRHVWEPFLPLYPALVFAAALSGLELRQLMLTNAVYGAVALATGLVLSMRSISGAFKNPPGGESLPLKKEWHILLNFLPLAAILFAVIVLHQRLEHVLAATVFALFMFYRVGARDMLRTVRYGFSKDVVVLIVGIMIFKFALENSGAVGHISQYCAQQQIPLPPLLFVLPFVTGLLTGITMAPVGSTFPLLISIAGGVTLADITFAFASGYAGVLLSPVHLCLVLTREYFKADLWRTYRPIIISTTVLMAAAFAQYLILRLL
ncbi:MAG: hypothetical protein FD164_1496 [Nitrospirae bacterium]|nr:MAG: hypothetical protein FD164_1496 [Nitrospirota bacterium]